MKSIFVGNLSSRTTDQDIRTLFEAHGRVDRINIVIDRASGGFGLVEMTNDVEAERTIAAINGQYVGGRALTVIETRI